MHACRFGIGITPDGSMSGTPTQRGNAVICSPSNGIIGQYSLTGDSFASILPHNTSGTTVTSCEQSGGVTVMTWQRDGNNGNASDAQINTSSGGSTLVSFAVGDSNAMTSASFPNPMSSLGVVLNPAPGPSVTPTPTPSPNPTPTTAYDNSVVLSPDYGLVLNWNVVNGGNTLQLQAVYNGTNWSVMFGHRLSL